MIEIRSASASARITPVAAMLSDVAFRLPSGRLFRPFAQAPWFGSTEAGLPGHLRWLGSEFVCLPFGVGGPLEEIAGDWRHLPVEAVNEPAHGPAAEEAWTVLVQAADSIRLALDYPADHPIRRLERSIAAAADGPALDLELAVESRVPARTSIGLHPILDLAVPERSLSVAARFDFGLTYPARVPGGGMASAVGRTFERLCAVPAAGGGLVDLSRLPLGPPVEDVVQLCGLRGPVEIRFEHAGAGLRIDWDRSLLPSCQMWISDRALQAPPWSGRYRGLGIEPIASAFDLANAVSLADNPIAERGVKTAVTVEPGAPLRIRYRLEAFEL
ncbi:hypothetical protein [Labrys monachus]|uniref:Aldose 1-epimerase n=1 Tax=Labrys monachus TaxID=217067 RepID=A0ABU0FM79_9HYPH|nr:hypothetical protein [Labrys monachus]MDQ0395710.1 hypothetical protein [Labrys monachus]